MALNLENIKSCIVATLDADSDVRQSAEAQLKTAESLDNFTDILLTILESGESQNVKLSAAIYIKNRVNRAWTFVDIYPNERLLSDEEKTNVRDRLLLILGTSPGLVRQQLVPLLQRILHWDYPSRWPKYMEHTMSLLNTNDAQSVIAGLQCLLAVCRTYRFKASAGSSRDELNEIVETSFPFLLYMCTQLLDLDSEEAGEMLHLALKIYKQAAWLDLPERLRTDNTAWCLVFVRTVSKEPPACSMLEDVSDREKHHWWKAKKWAYFNLNRLFMRHGNTVSVTTGKHDQLNFAKNFTATIAPDILKVYLQQAGRWAAKEVWMSRTCLSYTIVFLEECARSDPLWPILEGEMEKLLKHLLFPLLCLTEEDVESFTDDPEEYLHRKLNFYEEISSPDVAATNFLVCLVKARRPEVYRILTLVNEIVTKFAGEEDESERNFVEKDGALRVIGALAPILLGKKSPIADQVETFLESYVLPDFKSPNGILRARACDTIEKFESLDWRNPANLSIVYESIIKCMGDPELPVRITAALALQPLIRHDAVREHVRGNIGIIMSQLLKLANEADVDALSNVMEDFVEVFSEDLASFAVDLCRQLCDTYLRILRELLDRASQLDETDASDVVDDKSITALGVLQTIGTLIVTLEKNPETLEKIEVVIMPIVRVTLENRLYDLFNEVFEIIDSCTFSSIREPSPLMWEAFDLLYSTFNAGAELYLEDMLPALDNFVRSGAKVLREDPNRLNSLFYMVNCLFEDPKIGGSDRVCACRLAEAMMLSLPGVLDSIVPQFIRFALAALSKGTINPADSTVTPSEEFALSPATAVNQLHPLSYRVHLMEMVISAIHYNCRLALDQLESIGWTNRFFTLWFGNIDIFTRVHDKKLSIVAILDLLSLPSSNIPGSISVGWPRLLNGLLTLFSTLPAAMKNREDALKDDFQFGIDDDWDDQDDNAWVDEEETPAEGSADNPVKDENTTYIEFLSEEAQKIERLRQQAEPVEELGEESLLLESALDGVEPYQLFRKTIMNLQQTEPNYYQSLMNHLPQANHVMMNAILQQAHISAESEQKQKEATAAAETTALQKQGIAMGGLPAETTQAGNLPS